LISKNIENNHRLITKFVSLQKNEIGVPFRSYQFYLVAYHHWHLIGWGPK